MRRARAVMLRLGLRAKFFLYSNSLIVVTMGLVTVAWVSHERDARYESITARGVSLAEALAIPITDALLYEDLGLVTETGLIENYIGEILARNGDLMRYVVVTDAGGRVTHSNHWELLGTSFDRVVGPEEIGEHPRVEQRQEPGGGTVLEVALPLAISTRYWGSLAVGFSLEPIVEEVETITTRAMVVALVLMIGASALTAAYVETLIRPILHLNQTMKIAGRGNLTVRAPGGPRDEVGELTDAFNRMMDELEQGREREHAQQAQLAHTEKMAAVGTLAAGVAHEVNNPLAGILACVENMHASPDDAAMRHQYLELISDGLKRIERTVATLLDFSRPRAMRPEPTSINHNLRHVVELTEYQLRRAQIDVVLDLASGEPMVLADHFQMEQLFLNLVLNAIQAMPGGGTLTLRTRLRDLRVITEIQDTGEGIPQENLQRIFDPFFTTRAVGQGTGLGLAVTDNIVRAHGGRLEVESAPGKGSLFRVTFRGLRGSRGEGDGG